MKKHTIVSVSVVFTIILCICVGCVFSYNNFVNNYHGIRLENAASRIPIRMWNPNEDYIYISENMYSIIDKDGQYIIFGGQLERINSEDEKHTPFLFVFDPEFLEYNSTYSLGNLLEKNTDILQDVEESGEDFRYSYKRYYIGGKPKEEYEGYETYVVAKNEEEMRFIQVILYKESMALSETEKHEMFRNCNYKSSR